MGVSKAGAALKAIGQAACGVLCGIHLVKTQFAANDQQSTDSRNPASTVLEDTFVIRTRSYPVVLGAVAIFSALSVTSQQQPTETQSTTTTTSTTSTAPPPDASYPMTKQEMKAQRKQQKHEEKAAKARERAAKADSKSKQEHDKATDEQEKAARPQ
jgi:uncharacterized protein YaiL (DUF2058 family)